MSKDNKQDSKNTLTSIYHVLLIVLTIITIYNSIQINTLSKSSLANDIIISSTDMDTINPIENNINLSILIDSNYEGAMPIYIKLLEVRLNNEKITSDYKHSFNNQEDQIIKKDSSVDFKTKFNADKEGDYELDYIFYYDYHQNEDYTRGKSRTYTLKFGIK